MELRPYQKEAITAGVQALRDKLNPVIQLPTGSGKSPVIAHLTSKFAAKGGRTVVVTHVKELVEQNEKELHRYAPDIKTGVCCAGLNRYEPEAPVVFASIQTVYKKAAYFKENFHLMMVDEAHLTPRPGEGLMYDTFMRESELRRLGLSATPWRLDGGAIYGEKRWFDVLAYQKPALELVQEGYLAPLKGVETEWQLDTSKLRKTGGDFSDDSVEEEMTFEWLDEALTNALKHVKPRKHVLVFCPTVKTALVASTWLNEHGQTSGVVHADAADRDDQLGAWKAGEFKFMCNVDILTTGFNFPALDAIICLRPTQSSALWVQMLGRGMRLAAGKENCLVLDYVGNLTRLGGVDAMETWAREKGEKLVPVDPEAEKKQGGKRGAIKGIALKNIDPMLASSAGLDVSVVRCQFVVRNSAKQPGKKLLLAVYDCETEEGIALDVTQFVCVEYAGGARWHAEQWAKRRGYTNPSAFPREAQAARTECYALPIPRRLTVRRIDGHLNVIKEAY